ncbi:MULTISPECIES: extracellular solute-binding protein [Kitasatospora]|uniref:extracellular solute-binding protein n=1 Tax=Kitasatospora TaxID=2063 RepID=UPI000C70E90F|nr:extracellular solute-binding protein [Kitasatospora sp. GP30]MDH6144424.1 arabinogalactan oligomer/maltooligosaccharide transport system substrate-binding protein [Kitasatospora sp. GP30]
MRRGIAASALVAALAVTLAACGSSGSSGGSAPAAGASVDPSTVSGSVTYWDTSDAKAEAPTYQAVIADFEKKYPNIKVNYVNVPFGDAQNKVKNAFSTGSGAPDVIRSEIAWTPELAADHYLLPLDGTSALVNADDFLPNPVAATKYDGKTYAVPQVTDTMALFYNKKMFAAAGIATPPKSIDELKADSAQIKQKLGKTGFYLRGDDPYWSLSFLYGEGGDLVDANSKTVTVDNAAGVKAFSTIKDLVDSGAAKTSVTDGWANMMSDFQSGNVAMMINGPWSLATINSGGGEFTDKSNLGIAVVPAGSVTQAAPQGGQSYAIYAGSKATAASEVFVQYMASPEAQTKIFQGTGALPTRKSVWAEPAIADTDEAKFFKDAIDKAHQRPWIPEGGTLFDPLKTEYTAMLSGKESPQTAVKNTGDAYRKNLGWK